MASVMVARQSRVNMKFSMNSPRSLAPGSLKVVAEKFVNLTNQHGGVLDLKDAAAFLSVPKRRLYDVVNVLQGVGLMERVRRNTFRFVPDGILSGDDYVESLREECDSLLEEEASLDDMIHALLSDIRDVKRDVHAYVEIHELRSLQRFFGQTLIAVTSIPGVTSSISTENRSGTFKMMIKTEKGAALRAFLSPSDSYVFTDIDEITFRNNPQQKDENKPNLIVDSLNEEEITFHNELLDCILKGLLNSSMQQDEENPEVKCSSFTFMHRSQCTAYDCSLIQSIISNFMKQLIYIMADSVNRSM
ncbi:transcription factor E2F/dimerization partner [Necator americanus]|uniref:Transcription factor E2F/dimerization partner n=1 Tax=Necator americanus TaxID=51031 RepID=W2SQJ9_NECAM|nr:transcription factor E2F/dimerization partner [Necator americanus]ETN71151.1 transcription factor E2F/dimerization partner [Necator americanus]